MPSQSLKYPLQSLFGPKNYFLIINPDKDHTLHWGARVKIKKKKKKEELSIHKIVLNDKRCLNKVVGKNKKRFSTISNQFNILTILKTQYRKAKQNTGGHVAIKAQTKYFGGHVKST